MRNIRTYLTIIILVSTALIIYLGIAYLFWVSYYGDFYSKIDSSVWSDYGSFIGGAFGTLIATFAAYLAYRTYKIQSNQTERQQIENHFFTLLNIHITNVQNIIIDNENPNS